ncbi:MULTISPECIES: phosphate-starvation-inducible PsiE family protein [unclassified Prosthecochloris]|uniref:phosphate-starvation-inducible PsiE family protein n=1 Tax=unclassified Prosthecochloris TaxID=2632826 RepID=UPI00223D7027|nr:MULTISPECIES: phosphate-starvation-inducible PsiE family protein [unclassified Prosthecochloris]UZJ39611.1 phosphate-starvation-inducible PsiE family protein [Prosthecochloris sp. SCSIO W1102]
MEEKKNTEEDQHHPFIAYHEELPPAHEDPLIRFLHRIIRVTVKALAVLMVLVIMWGIGDVVFVLYTRLSEAPFFLLNINDLLETFGAFLAVLIAIEIFINIRLYLGTNIVPVKLVVATALMAISRKVIILDLDKLTPDYLLGIAAVVLGLGVSYWLIARERS